MSAKSLKPYVRPRTLYFLLAALLCATALVLTAPPRKVHAATTFTVNSLADTGDLSPDGACNNVFGNCTLREAIQEANFAAGTDTINFNIPGAGPHTIQLASALPLLNDSVDILNTSGESVTVRGEGAADAYSIFNINTGKTVNISDLTISNGNSGISGGGIRNTGTLTLTNCTVSGNSAPDGGGIYNLGVLTLTNTTVKGNSATFFGGGIFNTGTLNVTNSTVSDNSAGLGPTGSGGGIVNGDGDTLNVTNSTISGNSANHVGGGIFNTGSVTLTGVTITNNRADAVNSGVGSGGGIYILGGTSLLRSTIVAGNFNEDGATDSADDIQGGTADTASTYNLIGTAGSSGLTDGLNSNQVGVADPGLLPLADNGGPAQTHALSLTSPALDKGQSFGSTTDQRGSLRPFDLDDANYPNATDGDGSDIGAFELIVAITDTDDDGVPDASDNCPNDSNSDQADNDYDSIGNACDSDDDNDGVLDANDCEPFNAAVGGTTPFYRDADSDGFGDPNDSVQACTVPSGYVSNNTDNCLANSNPDQADTDHDGFGDACDPDDDNDNVPDVVETAAGSDPLDPHSTPEICDGVDNDLNDGVDEGFPNTDGDTQADCVDTDDDGDAISDDTEIAAGSDPLNSHSKPEVCDGVDNDLNEGIDEGFANTDGDTQADCVDTDDDGDGVSDAVEVAAGSDPLNAHSTPEVCDGVDNDLNEGVDEGFVNTDGDAQADCVDNDDDDDGVPDAVENAAGSDPLNAHSTPEICDGVDNDLDGSTDEGFTNTDGDGQADCVDTDDDGDGISDTAETAAGSDPLNSHSAPEVCDGVDNDLNEGIDEGFVNTDGDTQADCVDTDDDGDGVADAAEIAAGSDPLNAASTPEVCDGLDNDLDGSTDEGFTNTDGDGQADCVDADDDNDGVSDTAETAAGSDPLNAHSTPEVCDGVDNDLDGSTDEDFTNTDGDGQADCVDADDDNDGVLDANDCEPFNPAVSGPATFYRDADGDGFGDPNNSTQACTAPSGYVSNNSDNCPAISNADQADNDHDGIGDICDLDDDNDGVPDVNDCEPFNAAVGGRSTFYRDADGDGFGDPNDSTQACMQPPGYVSNHTDNCPALFNPMQSDNDHDGTGDACDPDDDNDGVLDANDCQPLNPAVGGPATFYRDADGDGFGDLNNSTQACTQPAGYVSNHTDNCPAVFNPTQSDQDHDGIGDACDSDRDGDGVPDVSDNCPVTPNPTQANFDGDHIGDACEVGPVKPTNKDQCKNDGWKMWTPRFKNQGDCIQFVNTGK